MTVPNQPHMVMKVFESLALPRTAEKQDILHVGQ